MVVVGFSGEFRQYAESKFFAEFNPHLVKRVNTPYNALNKNFVFVHGYQHSQSVWGELFYNYGVARAVAFEGLIDFEFGNFFFGFAG